MFNSTNSYYLYDYYFGPQYSNSLNLNEQIKLINRVLPETSSLEQDYVLGPQRGQPAVAGLDYARFVKPNPLLSESLVNTNLLAQNARLKTRLLAQNALLKTRLLEQNNFNTLNSENRIFQQALNEEVNKIYEEELKHTEHTTEFLNHFFICKYGKNCFNYNFNAEYDSIEYNHMKKCLHINEENNNELTKLIDSNKLSSVDGYLLEVFYANLQGITKLQPTTRGIYIDNSEHPFIVNIRSKKMNIGKIILDQKNIYTHALYLYIKFVYVLIKNKLISIMLLKNCISHSY